MPMNMTIQLDNDLLWVVASGRLFGVDLPTQAQVIIPIENLGDMTNEQIGQYVREAVPIARYCLARETALDITQYPGHFVGSISDEDMQLLQEHADRDADIRKAIALELAGPQPKKPAPPLAPKKRGGYIYLVESGGNYKIGLSNRPDVRMKQLGLQMPQAFQLLHTIPASNMAWAEKHLHQKFASKRLNGEWFQLAPDDVAWICALTELKEEADHG